MSVAGSGAAASGGTPLPPPVLVAETGDVRQFARLLRGIGLKHNAVMSISEAGFAVTVEEVKTLCAIAWIPTNLFSEFTFNEPSDTPACFELSLDGLLQCLNIFGNASTGAATGPVIRNRPRWAGDGNEDDAQSGQGGNKRGAGRTNMRMIWQGTGWPLSILLKDDNRGPVTNCELKVLEPEELMNQEFNRDECVLYLIMKSEWFRDALADLPPSSSKITLTATPRNQPLPEDQPAATASSNARRDHRAEVGNFSIKAEGDFGTTELDYPNDKEVMDRFDCDSEVSYSYHSSHFALLSRALNQSIKICLMIETDGFLCIQIMMPVQEGIPMGSHSGILEFKMHALEDDL